MDFWRSAFSAALVEPRKAGDGVRGCERRRIWERRKAALRSIIVGIGIVIVAVVVVVVVARGWWERN